ncbi:GerAB/ArcD/ProY family transporter [Haloplasma contractile]|uniref:GerAB/ArcD/ProY family transporter n=1 Tax=Haloplasma contractile TaxID=471825 RepID=UPI0002120DAC|nr:endospore germination permease [Haloplasma contractile]
MEKTNITPFQLFCLMIIAGLGSSSVLGVGMGAKQDAWITSLLGMVSGLILFLVYSYIFSKYPDDHFGKVLEKIFGKLIGKILSFIYVVHFIVFGTLVIRDIGEMVVLYVLPATPIYISHLLAMLVISYAVYLGIEVMARFNESIFFITLIIWFSFIILPLASGIVKIENMLPVLENGWAPVLKTTYPLTTAFPFSELFIFMMIFPHLNKKKKVVGTGLKAIFILGLLLTVINLINITSLGPYMAEKAMFPTLVTFRLISIGEAIQRVDSLAVILLMVGGGVKIAMYLYGVTVLLDGIFETKNYRQYIIPSLIAISFLTFMLADNLTRHIHLGLKIVPYYLNLPLEMIAPIVVSIIIFIMQFFKKRKTAK